MTSNIDHFDSVRFVSAQEGVYEKALKEIHSGLKESHWIWFVFPQIDGLGSSDMARLYAIRSLEEARAYLAHPVLGMRLIECADAMLSIDGKSALEILGSPDDLKLKSSMTLFETASQETSIFRTVLERFYAGERCKKTLRIFERKTYPPGG
jgi:uncharacterized protein (DUF1810 family)